MQFITITENIGFNNPIYGEGCLVKGKTYYTFSQFASETIEQGFAHTMDNSKPNVVFFQPSHLNSGNCPKKVLLMFSGGLGDAITVGLVLPLVMKKYHVSIDICCSKNKWEHIFKPMGLSVGHIPYPPDIETLHGYDAAWVDVTAFYISKKEGLRASPMTQLLRGFGVENEEMDCTYRIPGSIREKCRLLSTNSVRVGVNLDSKGLVKSYPEKWHRVLFQALRRQGLEIYILGARGNDQGAFGLDGIWDLGGQTSIPELAALLEQMDLVLGVDSFVVHLSNLLKIPSVVLLSTTAASSFSWHKHVSCMTSKLKCAPCFAVFDRCPRGHMECRAFDHESIRPDVIATYLQKHIRSQGKHHPQMIRKPDMKKECVEKQNRQRSQDHSSRGQEFHLECPSVDDLYEQGKALLEQGRINEAIYPWQKVAELMPENAPAHYNLGSLHMRNGEPQKAVHCYQQAVDLDSDYAQAWCNLGAALRQTGQIEQAIKVLLKAIRINPQYSVAHANLSECYEACNRLEEADRSAKTALEMDSEQPVARLVLAQIHYRAQRLAEARSELERVLRYEIDAKLKANAYKQYGRVLEKMHRPEEAYRAFVESRRLQSLDPAAISVDRRVYPAMLDHIGSWLENGPPVSFGINRTTVQKAAQQGNFPLDPVFLVGFPRSGTTLCEQILSAHSALVSSDERPLVDSVLGAIKPKDDPALSWTAALKASESDSLDWNALRKIYWDTARRLAGYHHEDKRFLDKLPLNIVHLGLIERLFPDSRVVVLLRDPRDVCLSAFQQDFVPNDAMIHLTSMDSTARLYGKVMGLWLAQRPRLSVPWTEVRYENMVMNTEKEIRRVLDFLGLPFDPAVLRYYESAANRHISTPSYYAVSQPVYTTSVGRWRAYKGPLAEVHAQLAPFVRAFGYGEE